MSIECNPSTDPNCVTIYSLSYALTKYPSDIVSGIEQTVLAIQTFNVNNIPTAYAFYIDSDQDIQNFENLIYDSTETFKLTPGSTTITKPNHNIVITWNGQIPTANYSNLPFMVFDNGSPISPADIATTNITTADVFALNLPGLTPPGSSPTVFPTPFPIRPVATVFPIRPINGANSSAGHHYWWIFGIILLIIVIVLILWLIFRQR